MEGEFSVFLCRERSPPRAYAQSSVRVQRSSRVEELPILVPVFPPLRAEGPFYLVYTAWRAAAPRARSHPVHSMPLRAGLGAAARRASWQESAVSEAFQRDLPAPFERATPFPRAGAVRRDLNSHGAGKSLQCPSMKAPSIDLSAFERATPFPRAGAIRGD